MDLTPYTSHDILLTLVTAVSVGTFLMAISQRVGVPAIVLLLGGGILLGPEVFGIIQPDSLGPVLMPLVSLAVGLILFEAGMTLDFDGYKSASKVIQRLLTIGTLITLLGTALAIHFIMGKPPETALLAASLVIVTGPTVILPLLKRIRVIPRVHHILQWEGVLIDPVGVFVAVLCFEFLTSGSGAMALGDFALRIVVGALIGLVGGFITYIILKKRLAPDHMIGVTTLACAAFTFGLSEMVMGESGLLSTIIAGFVPAILKPVDIKRVLHFKAEIADLLIAVLFMILASRLEFAQFRDFGWRGWLVVGVVMAVVRPVNILVCTYKQGLNWREKAFLSWLAPRGIVAASMASLFSIFLEDDPNFADPTFVETFTYSVIFGTILIEGLLANRVAIILGLKRPIPNGWLIVGAHEFGRRLANYIAGIGLPVAIIDSNRQAIHAINRGRKVVGYNLDARDPAILEYEPLLNMGNVLALTDNEDLNLVVCARLGEITGHDNTYAWVSTSKSDPTKSEKIHGIWPNLPKPTVLSQELMHYEARMFQVDGATAAPLEYSVLCSIGEESVEIFPQNPSSPPGPDFKQVALVRSSNHFKRSLDAGHTIDVQGTELRTALENALDMLLTQYPNLPGELLASQITAREQEFPTVLGHGVAVPHAYTKHIKRRVCCIIRAPDGVLFGQKENPEPVYLMFLVLSPSGDPEGHLSIMAEIAHLISDTEMRNRMLGAESAQDILKMIVNGQ